MIYFALIFSISTLCAGQILLKKSALLVSTLDHPFYLLLKPLFILALFSYGASMLSWIYVLQNMPLSRAYMFVSSAFIILPLLSCYFFGEHLNPRFFMGAALIIFGVFLTLK